MKTRINGGFPSAHVAMATCKDEQEIPRRQGGFLVAAALGHERRIRQSEGDPDRMGSFTYATMDAQEGHKLTVILVYRPCTGNADASGAQFRSNNGREHKKERWDKIKTLEQR